MVTRISETVQTLVNNYSSVYLTVSGFSEGIYREKGSKFIAYAAPCLSEDHVKQLLEEWRRLHPKARHLCYAYRIGLKGERHRANDDGEPAHSAGTPILGQIVSKNLTFVLVGVVRYFGGTKLGIPGLIHAYKTAAADALERAIPIEREVRSHIRIQVDYAGLPLFMNYIKRSKLVIEEQHLDHLATLQLNCKPDDCLKVEQELKGMNPVLIELIGNY